MLYAHAINDCRVVRLQLKWGGGTPKGTPSLGKIDRVRCAILALVPGAELLDIRMMKLNNWSIYHVELATREQAAAVIARHGEDWFGDGLPVEASLLGVDQEGRVKELARSRRVGGAAGMWKEERGVVVAAADFLPIVPAEVTVWRLAAEREQLLADQHELRLRVWRAEAAAVVAEAAVAAREPRRRAQMVLRLQRAARAWLRRRHACDARAASVAAASDAERAAPHHAEATRLTIVCRWLGLDTDTEAKLRAEEITADDLWLCSDSDLDAAGVNDLAARERILTAAGRQRGGTSTVADAPAAPAAAAAPPWRAELEALRDALECPIALRVPDEPVVAADGFTYERGELVRWLAASHARTSPRTNEPLAHANFLPNRALVEVASTLRRVLGDSTGGGTSARAREGVAASVPAADARKSGVRSGVQKQRGRRGRGSEARREEARREAHP